MSQYDPFTIEIIQSSLHAVTDEMFAAMRKTAMTSTIYEVLDFGVAITDAKGELMTQGAGVPCFIGVLGASAEAVLAKFGPKGGIHPGDIFITNDPYSGGVTHLNDVVVVMPIFYGGKILGWAANKAHWSDVGGKVAGSLSTDSTEIFQEGIQFPEVKLFERGKPIPSMLDMIVANSRTPDLTLGDMWAGIASIRVGERRLLGLAEKYGYDAIAHAMVELLSQGESVSRRALADLPKGVFTAEERTDDGLVIRVTVTVTDDAFIVDLRNNPKALAAPYNCSRGVAVVGAQATFKALTSPLSVTNAGTFRPLEVLTEPGTLFHAERPDPCGMFPEPNLQVLDLVWKAMAPHVPERLGAGHLTSVCGTIFAATHPDTGRFTICVEAETGGWGAGPDRDGENGQFCAADGETYNCPIEVNEVRNGIFVDRYAFHDHDGGEGMYRGGKGVYLDYRIRAADARLTGVYFRTQDNPPWGLHGGRPGSLNCLRVVRADGSIEDYNRVGGLAVQPGDVVRVITANGGGYGDPKKRPREKVLEDVKDGFVTPEQAEKYYGVTV